MNGVLDREVIELLRDDPDLLAVADAIVATQPTGGRGHGGTWRLLAVAAVAGVAAVLAIVAPWRGHGNGVVGRALAAVGHEPVLHAVIVSDRPGENVVTLATGRERPIRQRLEYWYDTETQLLRARETLNGRVVFDELVPRTYNEPRLDPGLTAFVSRYRNALKSGQAREIGRGTVDGRSVIWLRFNYTEFGERVGIDEHTYRPVVIQWLNADGSPGKPVWTVAAIDTRPYRPHDFKAPAPGWTQLSVSSKLRVIQPSHAPALLGWRPLWLRTSFRGLPLQRTEFMKLIHDAPLPRRTTLGVYLAYGRGLEQIHVSEAKAREQIYWLEAGGGPGPGEALLRRSRPGGGGPVKTECQAFVHTAGVWVTIEGWNQASSLCVDAARALVRIDP